MGLIMQEGKFVSRDEVARIDTPCSTASWKPVPHIEVIEAVTEVVKAHNWEIEGEKFGLAREGQKMFGVMEISRSSSPEWHRCIGISQIGAESAWRIGNTRDIEEQAEKYQISLMLENANQMQENQIAAIRRFIAYRVPFV